MYLSQEEKIITGAIICRGIAIGIPLLTYRKEINLALKKHELNDANSEVLRYRAALTKSKQAIYSVYSQLVYESANDAVDILEAHQAILDDPLLNESLEKLITEENITAEEALKTTLNTIKNKIGRSSNSFFFERFTELEQLINKILEFLVNDDDYSPFSIPKNSIIFTKQIDAIDLAEINPNNIVAIVTESCGETSHAAIISKSKGIPFLTNIDFTKLKSNLAGICIVDAVEGKLILNPSPKIVKKYELLKNKILHLNEVDKEYLKLPAETYDGQKVEVNANLESVNDLPLVAQYLPDGIGLFRTEFLLKNFAELTSKETQCATYKQLIDKLTPLPIVFRTFDFRKDKSNFTQIDYGKKINLNHLYLQIKSILKAIDQENVSLLIPMVTCLEDLITVKELIQTAKKELSLDRDIKLGCMAEVPSAILSLDSILKECDFVSLGTNDLAQFTLAQDREVSFGNALAQPSLLKMVELAVNLAAKNSKPLTLCGEVATNPKFIPLILGLGITKISVSPRSIPLIKKVIRSTSIVEAFELAQEALAAKNAKEILELLDKHYQKTALAWQKI